MLCVCDDVVQRVHLHAPNATDRMGPPSVKRVSPINTSTPVHALNVKEGPGLPLASTSAAAVCVIAKL